VTMIVSTNLVKMIMRPRCISAALHVFAVIVCAAVLNLVSVGAAQAHALHLYEATQMSTLPEGAVERGETAVQDGLATAERECGVACCSRAHCASGLVAGSGAALIIGCVAHPFVLAPDKSAVSFDQGTLKRPPRS